MNHTSLVLNGITIVKCYQTIYLIMTSLVNMNLPFHSETIRLARKSANTEERGI